MNSEYEDHHPIRLVDSLAGVNSIFDAFAGTGQRLVTGHSPASDRSCNVRRYRRLFPIDALRPRFGTISLVSLVHGARKLTANRGVGRRGKSRCSACVPCYRGWG